MPNYYAHLTFGEAVFSRLDPEIQSALSPQRQGFDCGLYGPDPLFFYHNGIPSPQEREAHELHSGPPGIVLERMRPFITGGLPYALGYTVGYFCHYLLDRACHPFVYANQSAKGISHMAMEGEFDRFLMKRDGIDPHRVTPLKMPEDDAVFAAASLAYKTTDTEKFKVSMAGFYRVSRALTLFQGTLLCPVVDLFTFKSESASGMLLHKSTAEASYKTTYGLLKLWEKAVEPAVPLVTELYRAYAADAPLDFLPPENFQGKAPEP